MEEIIKRKKKQPIIIIMIIKQPTQKHLTQTKKNKTYNENTK